MARPGPFADLHCHGEGSAWLDRLLAAREGRPAHDWSRWARGLERLPPGVPRLGTLVGPIDNATRDGLLDDDDIHLAVLEAELEHAAAAGAVLLELRIGMGGALQPRLPGLFAKALSRVVARYPAFVAVPILSGVWPSRPGGREALEACLASCPTFFRGIDFIPWPYEQDHPWDEAFEWAERFAAGGFGVTAHAGEFTSAHLVPVLELPGLARIGHATQAAASPEILRRIAAQSIVVECCLTSNVLLGAVEDLQSHPIRRFIDAGVRVAICTDNPLRMSTDIAREYQLAAQVGLDADQLDLCTRNAISTSFASSSDKQRLLDQARDRPRLARQ